jgi:hypothetical protein
MLGRPGTIRAGVGEDLGRGVIEVLGLHRVDDGDIVGDRAHVRQEFGDSVPDWPWLELPLGAEHFLRAPSSMKAKRLPFMTYDSGGVCPSSSCSFGL